MTKYSCIIADPPWAYSNRQNGAAAKHYPTMTAAQIKALPVSKLAERDCVLLLWATNPCLPNALDVIQAWGFTYKTAFPWIKLQNAESETLVYGTGYWIRGCSELILIASRGNAQAPRSSDLGILCSERFKHSRKPESLHDYAERNLPGPYLELFARETRPGWDSFGNELGSKSVSMPPNQGWQETKLIKGNRYKYRCWRDEQGRKRSKYLGKVQQEATA
ncbi:MT-A70 family methyltransferase [Thermosynechococcaceae cyanobacterium BACA0444]|uniref:MT-A70 family methyltransferase n=1 Tax=Pseudocalidococcus azoricus BACA0444 TaxID=2918990 RepID=A0AAE4JYV6_9CYAN|nr:MT-A70 family methyltransferase [Pseudocalidococcus azoricus]MDS3860157.1 MT-A70 family methyltransferase [Pseudocalidococcus azoricus BACA0444]